MWGGAFDALADMFKYMFVLIVIFVPLGMWKMFELLNALFKHIAWVN